MVPIRRFALTPRAAGALLAWMVTLPVFASAAAPWHDDLARAREASRASRRPILAVFTAAWQPGGSTVADVILGTPDARALVSSCFEPVIIDVDKEADLTRRLGIRHVPTAAVVAENDEVLASFACPSTTPEFVVAAVQAAQAAARQDRHEQGSQRQESVNAATATAASISLVTSEVGPRPGIASRDQQQADGVAPLKPTPFPRKPPTWPAEQPLGPLTATITEPPTQRPSLEPASATQVADPAARTAAPWLAGAMSAAQTGGQTPPQVSPQAAPQRAPQTTQQTAASGSVLVTDRESSASVSDIPASVQPQASPSPPKPSPAAQFLAAVQKPFAGFTRQPAAAAATGLPGPPAQPPTVAPARPEWPGLPLATAPRTAGRVATPPPQTAAAVPTAPPLAAPGQQLAAQPQAQASADPYAQESMPLGLEGYCPVTLASRGVWAEGQAQYGVRHRGRTYLFAGAAEQQAFLADPDRYSPALSGDDPVVALDVGRSLPGQRRFGVTYGSRMYLFSSPETRAAFQGQPERYAARIAQAEQPAQAGTRTY